MCCHAFYGTRPGAGNQDPRATPELMCCHAFYGTARRGESTSESNASNDCCGSRRHKRPENVGGLTIVGAPRPVVSRSCSLRSTSALVRCAHGPRGRGRAARTTASFSHDRVRDQSRSASEA